MSQELITQALGAAGVLSLVFFRQNQMSREEIAHAALDILRKLRAQLLTRDRALELLLATGIVGQATAERFVNAVMRRREGKLVTLFQEEIVPGVLITIDTSGEVRVNPRGLLNTLAHKVGKWTKKTFGLRLF